MSVSEPEEWITGAASHGLSIFSLAAKLISLISDFDRNEIKFNNMRESARATAERYSLFQVEEPLLKMVEFLKNTPNDK